MKSTLALQWEEWLKDAEITQREASARLGKHPTTLTKLFAKARTVESVDPAVSIVDGLAQMLRKSLGEMLGKSGSVSTRSAKASPTYMDEQAANVVEALMDAAISGASKAGQRVDLETMLTWWRKSDGLVGYDDKILENGDLVAIPSENDDRIHPVKMGRNSLATSVMPCDPLGQMARHLENMRDEMREELLISYRYAGEQKSPVMTGPHVMEITPPTGAPFPVWFTRVQFPIRTPNGDRFILNYSFVT